MLYNEIKNACLEAMCIDCTNSEILHHIHRETFCVGLDNGLNNNDAMMLADEICNLVNGKTQEEINALAEKTELPEEITWEDGDYNIVLTEESRFYIFKRLQEFTRENNIEIYRNINVHNGNYGRTEIELLCHEDDYFTEKQEKETNEIRNFIENDLGLEIKEEDSFSDWEIDEYWGARDYYTIFKIYK